MGGHAFGCTAGLLPIQLGFERTVSSLHHRKCLHLAMSGYTCSGGSRVMFAQADHRFATHLLHGRIVSNEVSRHDGCRRATRAFWVHGTLDAHVRRGPAGAAYVSKRVRQVWATAAVDQGTLSLECDQNAWNMIETST